MVDDSEYGHGKRLTTIASGTYPAIRRGTNSDDDEDEEDEDLQQEWEDEGPDHDSDDDVDVGGHKTVAAGAPFLEQDAGYGTETSDDWFEPKSRIAKLPIGHGYEAQKLLHDLGYATGEGAESEAEEEPTAYAGPAVEKGAHVELERGPRYERASFGNTAAAPVIEDGSNQLSMSAVTTHHLHHDSDKFGASSDGGDFANGYGGLPIHGGITARGAGTYQTMSPMRTDAYQFGATYQSPNNVSMAPVAYRGHGYDGFEQGSSSYNRGDEFDTFSARSVNRSQPETKIETPINNNCQAVGVPQQANIPRARDSWLSATSTHMHPTPDDGPIGDIDSYLGDNNGYFDYEAAVHSGAGAQYPFSEFTAMTGVGNLIDEHGWGFSEFGAGGQ